MSNGFSAADMSTAAANGHTEGYQVGYADAVKAFDAAQPAAEPVVPTQEMLDAGINALLTFRKSGGDFTVHPSHAAQEVLKAALAASTPAAPGIDLEPLIAIRNQLHQMSAAKDLGEGWADVVIELVGDVQKVIDASPKGGSDAYITLQRIDVKRILAGDENSPGYVLSRRRISDCMQATSAEVGS